MEHYNFVATDKFDLGNFKDIEKFVNAFPDFQTVVLQDEKELSVLFGLIGTRKLVAQEISSSEFSKYWDLSSHKLPELNEEEFDRFYEHWVSTTGRDNNMDEFGSLIFLQGLSEKWNKRKYRLVVKMKQW